MVTEVLKALFPPSWVSRLRGLVGLRAEMEAAKANARVLAGLLYSSQDSGSSGVAVGDHHSVINHYELKLHSQNGEDGILLYILAKTGTVTHRLVELGVGSGRECNTANLAFGGGWSGLWVDQSTRNVKLARYYCREALGPRHSQVKIVSAHLTAENVNGILSDQDYTGEIDVLSIDVDGIDYWLWRAIEVTSPRVVVVEYNATFGPVQSVTVPYDPDFDRLRKHASGFYHGSSLAALTKLAQQKGYVLVGCDSSGVNAFYVRNDVAFNRLPTVEPEVAYYPERRRSRLMSVAAQLRCIQGLALESV